MKVCIVGGGIAGLCTAKVLGAFGHQVCVFEKEPEVGGVWSASRRYPGLVTQNVRDTYAFSDFPFPRDYPEWPVGEQVQRYLAAYARHFGLEQSIRLRTEIVAAMPSANGWTVVAHDREGRVVREEFDYLVVCNGVFSQPRIPDYAGKEAFAACGGRLCHTSEVNDAGGVAGRHVLIVGYGKSSCDLAMAVATTAFSTTMIVRELIWKVPKRLMNVVNYKYVLLTRLGEAMFEYIRPRGFERFLHGVGRPVRNAMLGALRWIIARQCHLERLKLTPRKPFEAIARSTISLVSDGFYESVAGGEVAIARNASIVELLAQPDGPHARLSDGRVLPADIVVCGTGWHQGVPFLDAGVIAKVTDAEGNFRLYRSIIPPGVPRLAFNGYASSLFSQLNAETGALWLADLLAGRMRLPPEEEQHRAIGERLAWMDKRTEGRHLKGVTVIPFSLHHVDELMEDMGLHLRRLTRLKQWLLPVNPGDFAFAVRALQARLSCNGTPVRGDHETPGFSRAKP